MLVDLGRSCNVEGIGLEIGEVIDMVSCKEGCRESNVRIGWRIGSIEEVEVVGGFVEVIVGDVLLGCLVEPVVVVEVDIVVVVEVQELEQAEMEH